MFKYGIGITDKPQVVESTLRAFNNNCFVISLEEEGSIFNLALPNFTKGTILLPPPTAEIAAIDGDEHRFTELYYSHLCELSTLEFISLLMYTAHYSMPVLLYIPSDSLYVANFLMDFFSFNFGVLVANDSVAMQPNLKLEMCNVLSLFYIFNFIDVNIFINEYIQISKELTISFVPIQELVLDKFCIDTGFINTGQYITMDQLFRARADHFLRMINSTATIIPFSMGGQQC